MRLLFVAATLACLSLALGCDDSSSEADASFGTPPGRDAGGDQRFDAQPNVDLGNPPRPDAQQPQVDAEGPQLHDVGVPTDAEGPQPPIDAGTPTDADPQPPIDAGTPTDTDPQPPVDAETPTDTDPLPPIDAEPREDVGGPDPCQGQTLCAEAGWSCQGDTAVQCWYDENDCLIETRTDCTLLPFGYCSEEGVLPGCREADGPCPGSGTCPAETYCEGDVLNTCITGEDGCAELRVTQTCTNEGKICAPTDDGGAECVLADPSTVSQQIAEARDAIADADNLPWYGEWGVENAIVTMVKPLQGADDAGFVIQGERQGPALFILHEDPVGVVEVGDEISIWFDEVDMDQGRSVARALAWLDIWTHENDVSAWAQDVTNVDIVAGIQDYEYELITIEAEVTAPFASAGPQFVDARIQTPGVAAGDLRFRVPTTLSTTLLNGRDDLVGCTVRIGPTPLWRYLDRVQPQAMDASEIEVDCP